MQGHPARRLAGRAVHLEPYATAHAPVQRPPTVVHAARADVVDRLAQPRVGRCAGQLAGGPEVVERAQDVVAPAGRVQEGEEALVGRLAGAEAAEEMALQEELLARGTGGAGLRPAARRALELEEPFQHVDRGRERGPRRAVGPLAVPAAVLEALAHEALDDR